MAGGGTSKGVQLAADPREKREEKKLEEGRGEFGLRRRCVRSQSEGTPADGQSDHRSAPGFSFKQVYKP